MPCSDDRWAEAVCRAEFCMKHCSSVWSIAWETHLKMTILQRSSERTFYFCPRAVGRPPFYFMQKSHREDSKKNSGFSRIFWSTQKQVAFFLFNLHFINKSTFHKTIRKNSLVIFFNSFLYGQMPSIKIEGVLCCILEPYWVSFATHAHTGVCALMTWEES